MSDENPTPEPEDKRPANEGPPPEQTPTSGPDQVPPPPGGDATGAAPPPPPPPPPPAGDGSGAAPPPPPPPPPGNYPPPPGPAPQAGWPGATRTFSVGEAFSYGWSGFKNNIGPLLIIGLVLLAVNVVLALLAPNTWLDGSGGLFSVWGVLFNIIQWIVTLIIALGLIRATLAILDGRAPSVDDLLSTRNIVPYAIASILVGIIVGVGILLCIIPGLIAGFLLQFYGYAIVDTRSPDAGTQSADPIGGMKRSYQVVSKNIGSLILLGLMLLLLNFGGALLCGIGLLVTIPISMIATGFAWRFFSGGAIAPQRP